MENVREKLRDSAPDIERLQLRADTLKAIWLRKKHSLEKYQRSVAKAKAEYFDAHETLTLAQANTLVGRTMLLPPSAKKLLVPERQEEE